MKISEPDLIAIDDAVNGSLAAIDLILKAIQPGIYKLAVHVLGNRDDASDSTQEILLKIVTHMAGFRRESAFSTWVWRVAYNHLLTARTKKMEFPELSLEYISSRLELGLEFASNVAHERGEPGLLSPQDKLEARQIALACTQSMLMTLDRESRLVYVMDTVFGLASKDASAIIGITSDAYRQRLSRARYRLNTFVTNSCGLCSTTAACRCELQLPASRHPSQKPRNYGDVIAITKQEQQEAESQFAAFSRVCDAAAIIRAHPAYTAPEEMHGAILAVLTQEGFIF